MNISAEDKVKELEGMLSQANALLDTIYEITVHGIKPSDFMLSYPMIERIWTLYLKANNH